ncbi:MAG: UvrD-helicase domain-containing protein [Bacteroidales bacterium]|nr:UvrD-helicase domain-containing protein [Bacteroidales bacterium]
MTAIIFIFLFIASILFAAAFTIRKRRLEKKHKNLLDIIEHEIPKVEEAFTEVSTFYNYNHYITESERLYLEEKYSDLLSSVKKALPSTEFSTHPSKEKVERFNKALTGSIDFKKINNSEFIRKQLSENSSYFDTVLPYPLDAQQREAIVSLEDNVLVISSAGSGKTMTTVGKVRYLIDVQKVDPKNILLITFTRKASESLSERLGEKDLKCRTFHKLALDIISEVTGKKPTITGSDFSAQVYHELFDNDPSFHQAIVDYILHSRYTMKSQFEYSSMQEYIEDRQKYGRQAYFKDMDGKPVFCKSDEESMICDFLGSRGVSFRYEEKYQYDMADSEHRQYCPDFSIYFTGDDGQSKRIYLEHFAVNEQGKCPKWFTEEEQLKYKEGIAWKRSIHQEKGTILIETTSAGFQRNDVFTTLAKQLTDLGVVFNPTNSTGLSRELAKQEENILNTLTAFLFLLKSQGASPDEVRKQADKKDRPMLDNIVFPFISAYNDIEGKKEEIDFTDAIIEATRLCNNGHRPDYDYILVDEFQDISKDRYRFLQSLRRQSPLTKLFCVGDDWQSIYRFAGSDMALFKQFEKYFGFTKKCLMETTYRFGEPAIERSSNFILKNPEQASKQVHSFRQDASTNLDFIPTYGPSDIARTIMEIADSIPPNKEILLIGRYSFDVRILEGTSLSVSRNNDGVYVKYGSRRMNFMTVHQSKGLECDYVIMLNCNGGSMGFPSDIADSPILKYVLSEPDSYSFSEERRVFYVGITRAKRHTWVLYDESKPSPFVGEFISLPEKQQEDTRSRITKSELCPKCHCGRIIVLRKGTAINGNPYSFQVCSNEKYGCDYHETVFVNLNSRRRPIGYKK